MLLNLLLHIGSYICNCDLGDKPNSAKPLLSMYTLVPLAPFLVLLHSGHNVYVLNKKNHISQTNRVLWVLETC